LKKIPTCSTVLFFIGIAGLSAQTEDYYSNSNSSRGKKYFISAGYGLGASQWFSNSGSSSLYDRDGNLIPSENGRFRASNASNCVNFEVGAPISKFRVGLGISFENNYLDELTLIGNSYGSNGSKIIFDQTFGFEKMYAHFEAPLIVDQQKLYSLNFKGNIGFYGYSGGTAHEGFFGGSDLPSTFYTGAGLIADYKLTQHLYVFLNPLVEYQYFKNSSDYDYSKIVHNIISFSVIAGVRLDISRN